jgi:hypothetical protein
MDLKAAEHIAELESQLEDAYIKIDLLEESLLEAENKVRIAIKQLEVERQNRSVDYGVA